ncbi:MAG: response regulator [Verrucomicrobia bacterium]|nr:response regulator [Verrucomicrobiota bacterium]
MKTPTKILITEDEMIVALDLERRLKKLGFDCILASSGEQALDLAAQHKPDVALMDICLQGEMDGIAAAGRIRLQNEIPIIYLTANADEHTLQRAEITHPASYLLKPFKERELHICIEMALINHALQQELRSARAEMEKKVIARTAELLRTNETLRKEILSRQESEAQVREQAALLDKSRDAIFVRNLEGQILYWNLSAERLYGFSKIDAIGQSITDILHTNTETEAKALERTLHNGEWMGELIHQHRSGKERIVESRWTFMPDKSAILIVETDISERKLIEAQFLRAQRLESVGALASGIAHDLNNVFTPLLMTAQLLTEEATNPDSARMAEIMLTSANRGSKMVKQVLMFVRGSEGERQPFRIEHLVKELVSLLRETFPKSIRLRSTYTEDLWSVIGDATRLHQLLMNLCVNARDAMPAGGALTIALKNFSADEAYAGLHGEAQPGEYVCLSVSDTGTGMSAELKQKIFDPFFTTKEPGKGTGLGLATVQSVVREHGGFLNVESTLGTGTSFHIFLPGCNDLEVTPEPAQLQLPRGNGQQILIIDDERMVREIVKTALEAFGYRVITADDGADALSKFAVNQNDLAGVIVDLQMPHLNGVSCIQTLRRINKDIPILSISGSMENEVPRAELESQQAAFLAKPFTKGALLGAVHQMLTGAMSTVTTAR